MCQRSILVWGVGEGGAGSGGIFLLEILKKLCAIYRHLVHLGRVLRYALLSISISFKHDDCTALPEGGVRQSTAVRASEDDCNERRQAKTVYTESTVPLTISEWCSSDLSPEMHATKETEWHPL